MNLKFGMPEVLVISATFLYSQSFWLSIILLTLGILSKVCVFCLQYSEKQELKKVENEQTKKIENAFESLQNSLISMTVGRNFDDTAH